jgi:cell division protease FtsH
MTGAERQEPMFHREYSEATQQYIDEEIAHVVEERYAHVKKQLSKNRALLDKIAGVLLDKETIDEKEFRGLMETAAVG